MEEMVKVVNDVSLLNALVRAFEETYLDIDLDDEESQEQATYMLYEIFEKIKELKNSVCEVSRNRIIL